VSGYKDCRVRIIFCKDKVPALEGYCTLDGRSEIEVVTDDGEKVKVNKRHVLKIINLGSPFSKSSNYDSSQLE